MPKKPKTPGKETAPSSTSNQNRKKPSAGPVDDPRSSKSLKTATGSAPGSAAPPQFAIWVKLMDGEGPAFQVYPRFRMIIDSLKKAIKEEKKNLCQGVDADEISIFDSAGGAMVPEDDLQANHAKTAYQFSVPTRSTPRGKVGTRAPALATTLSVKVLEAKFGSAQFSDVAAPTPLGEATWDRSTTETEFDDCVRFLHLQPSKKVNATAEGRHCYPLTAVLGRPGAGKTFLLQLLGSKKAKTHVGILISLGNGTKVRSSEIAAGADDAIALRILYTLFRKNNVSCAEFLSFCQNYTVPTIKEAIGMVKAVAKRPNDPCLLLVDESAAAMTIAIDGQLKQDFSADVLTAIGEVQEHAVSPIATGTKNAAPGIYAVVTSLYEDVVKKAQTRSGRPVKYLSCDAFSDETLCALREMWSDKFFKKHPNVSEPDAINFVEKLLIYSGGVPRAVQWVYEQLFVPNKERTVQLNKYYDVPPWEVVQWCLRGQNPSAPPHELATAVALYGARFDSEGVPTLPPFQLTAWSHAAVNSSNRVEASVAETLQELVPLKPPEKVGDLQNDGGQRLTFEMVTQAFEIIQHELLDGKIIDYAHLFPGKSSIVTNLPQKAKLGFKRIRREADKVRNYPQDLKGELKKEFVSGELLVAPSNPQNVAVDYGTTVTVQTPGFDGRVQQDSQNKFKDRVAASTIARNVASPPLVKPLKRRLVFIYTKNDTATLDDKLPWTVVVLREGSRRLLSGLGGVSLTFRPSATASAKASKNEVRKKKRMKKK